MRKRLTMISLSALILSSGHTIAAECTPYENGVYVLAKEARAFQKSNKFKEYGFGAGGPFNRWLKEMQAARDHPEARDFFIRNGFPVMNIYSVADEYRTEGRLDDFWKETEDLIEAGIKRCDR